MEYPLDQASRHCLNLPVEKFENWGLLVLQEAQVIDIQRWNRDERLSPPNRPEGMLLNFKPDGQRLTLFLRKNAFEWNLITGFSGPRKYQDGEKKKNLQDFFKAVPGQPQFRAGSNWCVVIADGSMKLTSPMSVFAEKQKEWNDLPATQRSMLLSEGARKSSARHAFFTAKAVAGIGVAAGLLYGAAMLLQKLGFI
ncbi:MAG: hypothetical protein KC800_04115 [Candidatus Eremiobacteraeota bacterium]|nr:hypothetical protein [Candidatus Eremiobacteraeota bacterium]